nr:hypothetical protein Iba_chr11bCG11660 [Ipomoea batatas]
MFCPTPLSLSASTLTPSIPQRLSPLSLSCSFTLQSPPRLSISHSPPFTGHPPSISHSPSSTSHSPTLTYSPPHSLTFTPTPCKAVTMKD